MDATLVKAWLDEFAAQVDAHSSELTDLDRMIGDADHGSNLDRGMKAVAALDAAELPDAAALLKKAGMTLVSTVGGAAGPLFGTLLLRMASALPEGELDAAGWASVVQAGFEGVQARGKAAEGDKTMVDALAPAARAARGAADQDCTLAEAIEATAEAARRGRDATVGLVARKGRASYLGERSAGHADPGATSVVLLLESARILA